MNNWWSFDEQAITRARWLAGAAMVLSVLAEKMHF